MHEVATSSRIRVRAEPQVRPARSGLLILKDAVQGITPATLPTQGFLDDLQANDLWARH
jgi:hypothetical protein